MSEGEPGAGDDDPPESEESGEDTPTDEAGGDTPTDEAGGNPPIEDDENNEDAPDDDESDSNEPAGDEDTATGDESDNGESDPYSGGASFTEVHFDDSNRTGDPTVPHSSDTEGAGDEDLTGSDSDEETGAGDPTDDGPPGLGTTPSGSEDREPVATDYGAEGAPDDEEMPLAVHIEEMVRRLAVVLIVLAVVSAIVLPLSDRLINFLWYSFLPGPPTECVRAAGFLGNGTGTGTLVDVTNATLTNATSGAPLNATGGRLLAGPNGTLVNATAGTVVDVSNAALLETNATGTLANVTNATLATAPNATFVDVANGTLVDATSVSLTNLTNASATMGESGGAACPRLYHPLALVFARLKMASLAGFVVALPVFVYETYLFMRPGLYRNERRYYLASVPTSLILAGIGLAFAYFLVLPVIFVYFLGYSQPVADVAFGLTKTFNLILLMLGMFALIFQIPLFIMLAIMMGVTSRRWLEGRRLYFWFGFAGIAFIFSPDPTGMAPFIVAATMVLLFEGTLLLLRWTGR